MKKSTTLTVLFLIYQKSLYNPVSFFCGPMRDVGPILSISIGAIAMNRIDNMFFFIVHPVCRNVWWLIDARTSAYYKRHKPSIAANTVLSRGDT
jgi:hypothetical protein